jgi:predicted metal-dependent hydrolase
MYVIELHDDQIDNQKDGTLVAHIGRRHGTIEYAYQVEMHLQDVLEKKWRRAYLKTGNKVNAIWVRNMKTGAVQYLARDASYDGEWVLPFVGSSNAHIAVGIWGSNACTDAEALNWATAQLKKAVTAIILDRGEIRFAWELVNGSPKLITRGPHQRR